MAIARAQFLLASREAKSYITAWEMTGRGTSMCSASSTSQLTSPVSSTYEGTFSNLARHRHQRHLTVQTKIQGYLLTTGFDNGSKPIYPTGDERRVAYLPYCVYFAFVRCCNFRRRFYCVRIIAVDAG
jgi:hypothetical protein